MPIYDRIADVEGDDIETVQRLLNLLMANINGPVDTQIELVHELSEYLPILLLNVVQHSWSVCTVSNYQADGIAFLVMAGPVNDYGPVVFVPQPEAAGVMQRGKANLQAFLSGSYVWRKT